MDTHPASLMMGAFAMCPAALVQSNTISMEGSSRIAFAPLGLAGMPASLARRRPGDSRLLTIIARFRYLLRLILTIRSLPMLPGPMIATLIFSMTETPALLMIFLHPGYDFS